MNDKLCNNCGTSLNQNDKFCGNCGLQIENSDNSKTIIKITDFDPIYNANDKIFLQNFIKRELKNINVEDSKMASVKYLKKKNTLNFIFSLLLFICISSIFFHFPLKTYFIEIIILIIYFIYKKKYSYINYLIKEIKTRPSEKISNILMNEKNNFVKNNSSFWQFIYSLLAFFISITIFMNPRIMYEQVENGYAVRFYTYGYKNFRTVTIPDTYKNKPVVSLRGNTFSNMFLLETVNLPNTITEIRGQAFKNDYMLKNVNIPEKLEYLGGGTFYNCESIKSIILPDTLAYMGGETFYNATALTEIKLSKNLTEIRGNTFENCYSLIEIEIPDKVTRIGGHAFRGDYMLSSVTFSQNSMLSKIGSSAFRGCTNLQEVTMPQNVFINERAFKETYTVVRFFNSDKYYTWEQGYQNANY